MRFLGTSAGKACIAAIVAATAVFPQARIEFSEKIRLLDCSPASNTPAFGIRANIVGPDGAPVGVALPPAEMLAQEITVQADGLSVTPFYAAAGADEGQKRTRTAILLIDASGSMLQRMPSGQTRYEAAKAAAMRFLDGFEEGSDQVAVVPFESHGVVTTIRAAEFASTAEGAAAQIRALPDPQVRNNTALYSAMDAALTVLETRADPTSEQVLMVLTDGKNDVGSNDDPGLLGDEGLARVAERVAGTAAEVVGIGLGNSQSIDSEAMERVSSRFYLVSDEASLARVFSFARELLLNRLHVTFLSPWADRASLAGKSIHARMLLRLPNGQDLESEETVWSTPQMGTPVFEGSCGPAELKAVIVAPGAAESGGWMSTLRPVLVFIGLGALLLALWFWVPRLVWPEQYLGNAPVVASRGRWTSPDQTRLVSGGVRGDAPPGFAPAGGSAGGGSRGASDRTVVAPRAGGAPGTETRLSRNPGGRDPRNR